MNYYELMNIAENFSDQFVEDLKRIASEVSPMDCGLSPNDFITLGKHTSIDKLIKLLVGTGNTIEIKPIAPPIPTSNGVFGIRDGVHRPTNVENPFIAATKAVKEKTREDAMKNLARTPFDDMTIDKLRYIILKFHWGSEINVYGASRSELVDFLKNKDQERKEYIALKKENGVNNAETPKKHSNSITFNRAIPRTPNYERDELIKRIREHKAKHADFACYLDDLIK